MTESEHTDHIAIHDLPLHPARVRVEAGVTRSPAPYESVRIGVMIEMPCDPARVDETYASASRWVESRMEDEIEKVMQG